MTPTEQDKEQRFYEPDDIDDLVVWTFPCADCGEVGCPYMYGEDRKELEERLRALITTDRKRVALEARIDEVDRLRLLAKAEDTKQYVNLWVDAIGNERIAELKAQQEEVNG